MTEEGITVHKVFKTEFPADCAEFCPFRGAEYPLILACGTYYLKDPATQTKEGAIELYTITPSNAPDTETCTSQQQQQQHPLAIERVQRFTTGAVFDFKWCQTPTPSMLIARADGYLSLHSATVNSTADTNTPVSSAPIAEYNPSEGPATYVATVPNDRALCCHGGGRCSLWDINTLSNGPVHSWTGHEYETWVAASAEPAGLTDTVWSGGDDAYVRGWDLRTDCSSPIFEKRRTMGITAISFHKERPVVAVGSYDESLTLWDARFPRRPLFEMDPEATEGGGVWRIKWNEGDRDLILAACMHAGYRVFRMNGDGESLDWVKTYHGEHKSLAYGADWAPIDVVNGDGYSNKRNQMFLAATCSFYDNTLSFWSFNNEIKEEQT